MRTSCRYDVYRLVLSSRTLCRIGARNDPPATFARDFHRRLSHICLVIFWKIPILVVERNSAPSVFTKSLSILRNIINYCMNCTYATPAWNIWYRSRNWDFYKISAYVWWNIVKCYELTEQTIARVFHVHSCFFEQCVVIALLKIENR